MLHQVYVRHYCNDTQFLESFRCCTNENVLSALFFWEKYWRLSCYFLIKYFYIWITLKSNYKYMYMTVNNRWWSIAHFGSYCNFEKDLRTRDPKTWPDFPSCVHRWFEAVFKRMMVLVFSVNAARVSVIYSAYSPSSGDLAKEMPLSYKYWAHGTHEVIGHDERKPLSLIQATSQRVSESVKLSLNINSWQ